MSFQSNLWSQSFWGLGLRQTVQNNVMFVKIVFLYVLKKSQATTATLFCCEAPEM